MTSKSVELAIFWLPLLAGILLSGLAGSAWYGGDKIPALWIAFVGGVFLLLTATLQFQQFVYANLLQPEIEIVGPSQRTILTWNPPASFFMNSRTEDKPAPGRDFAISPVIIFENKSSVIGQDASIEWDFPQYDVKALADSSSRLKNYEVIVRDDTIVIGPRPPFTQPTGLPFQFQKIFRQSVPALAYLGKRVESWIPGDLWTQAMLYFVATLPGEIGGRSPPLVFTATVKWNIPENGKSERFKVTAIATNANTPGVEMPKLTAYVSFSAEKIKGGGQ
ncbi:hypothetical protein [Bradyrhizobium sp. SZCCHNRI2007]|uniref:hypothetical protein n=1 Tax=Bradyrhizobium sp. SZCCHNRI2007 TaxID=3057281 RepID=UPI0028E942EB|nr:hypothetical protein [Bradyrhizobium sp. SZCCHNRI2007]